MSDKDRQNISYYDRLADSYELFFEDFERNMQQEGDWLEQLLRAHQVKTVLDASAGSGRQAIPLCERGFDVIAADPSESMLKQAASRAGAHNVSLPLVRAAFEELPNRITKQHDAVIALGNGLAHLQTREDVATALVALRRCCRPGGICVVGLKDFARIGTRRTQFHPRGITGPPATRKLMFEVWDHQDATLLCTAFLLQRDETSGEWRARAESTRELILHENELSELACRAGFGEACRLHHPSEAVFLFRPQF